MIGVRNNDLTVNVISMDGDKHESKFEPNTKDKNAIGKKVTWVDIVKGRNRLDE